MVRAIDQVLQHADLVLLLVSADFLNSGYCRDVELNRALERTAAGKLRILPVYLRPAVWQGAPFAGFQGVPNDARPLTDYPDPDAAWVEVVEGIKRAAREIRGEAGAAPAPPEPEQVPKSQPEPKLAPRRRNAALTRPQRQR